MILMDKSEEYLLVILRTLHLINQNPHGSALTREARKFNIDIATERAIVANNFRCLEQIWNITKDCY